MRSLSVRLWFIFCVGLVVTGHAESLPTTITPEQCTAQNGVVVSGAKITYYDQGRFVTTQQGCVDGHSVGRVSGMQCPCVCCVGEKVVDCQKNDFKITKICDAGQEIRYEYQYSGTETPTKIRLELTSDTYRTSVFGSVTAHTGEQRIVLDPQTANKGYTRVESYQIEFKDIPFSKCRYERSKIKVQPCADRSDLK